MGGKKKGGLANRLARMTDDERAKYLQRKADMEEEARRRKEQLVAAFMKNKLKKEDGFSRLNLAKINQEWHQVMRSDKCKGMKAEGEYLRKWMDRTVTLKNRTIKKLMEELDWQEGLYGTNFTAHSDHIDQIIEFHSKHLDEVCKQYEGDRKLILHIGATERQNFETITGEDIEHLKAIIYGQQIGAERSERENREEYMNRTDEILSTYRTELSQMKKEREKISCALWRQMSKIITAYVQQTDVRRSHLAELRRLDTEGAVAITKNQQLITNEENQLEKLKHEYSTVVETRQEQISNLENTVKATTKHFFLMRKRLFSDIKHDEKQLGYLTEVSSKVIEDLKKLAGKGQQILLMVQTCGKLEHPEEKTNRWSPLVESASEESVQDEGGSKSSTESEDVLDEASEDQVRYKPKYSWEAFAQALVGSTDTSSYQQEGSTFVKQVSFESRSVETTHKSAKAPFVVLSAKSGMIVTKIRPKTEVAKPRAARGELRQLKSEEIFQYRYSRNQEDQVFQISTRVVKTELKPTSALKTIKTKRAPGARPTKSALVGRKTGVSRKLEKPSSAPTSITFSETSPVGKLKSSKTPDSNFEGLDKLEGLWWVYNKVEMDCMKMRQEKKALIAENSKLKAFLRDVLEASALGQSIPSGKSSTSSSFKSRFILSAPLPSYTAV